MELTSVRSWVVGLALLADTVPQEHLTQAMGYVSLGMSLGILIAPLLGGIVFDRGGYNAVFGMAYALIGVDVLLRLLLVEKKIAARWDPAAAVQVRTTARQGLVAQDTPEQEGVDVVRDGDMVVQSTDLEKGAPVISDPAAATTVNPLTILPAETESRRRRDRLPPVIGLLYSRRLLSALWAAMIQAAIFTGFDSTLTLRAAELFHWSSTGAALLFLPIAVPSFLAPLAGWLMDKFGGRYPAAAGFLLATVPLVCLGFVQENSISDKVLLCALLALTGLTLVLTFSPIMAEISAVVEDKEKKMLANGLPGYGKGGAYAQAYALFNMAFAAGCMIGPLVAGTVVEKSGWATMGWVMGLLSGVTAIPTFLWLGGWLFQKKSGDR
jgi:MFS family permease